MEIVVSALSWIAREWHCFLQHDPTGWLTAGFTGVAVVVAGLALRAARATEWREVVNTYFREYRGLEVGKAVDALYRLYESSGRDPVQMIKTYIPYALKSEDFHLNTRRTVSALYQEIGALVHKSSAMRRIVLTLWAKHDLDIIVKILLPLEIIANPIGIHERDTWLTLTDEERDLRIRRDVEKNMRKVWPTKKGKADRTLPPIQVIRKLSRDAGEAVRLMYDLWEKAKPKKHHFIDVTEEEMRSSWWTYRYGPKA